MTKRHAYLRQLRGQSTDWLAASAANPSQHMTRGHVALHLLEMRRRARITSYYASVATQEGWA